MSLIGSLYRPLIKFGGVLLRPFLPSPGGLPDGSIVTESDLGIITESGDQIVIE